MDDPNTDAVAALQREVENLRAEVASLRTELSNAHGRVSLSMRDQRRCPSCGGTTLLHSKRIFDAPHPGSYLSLVNSSRVFDKRQGSMEAYICMDCGLMEWFADTSDVDTAHEQFRVIEGNRDGSKGPYR